MKNILGSGYSYSYRMLVDYVIFIRGPYVQYVYHLYLVLHLHLLAPLMFAGFFLAAFRKQYL